jgi:3-oxoacyl-[acyl-carrier-protein] synthase-3
VIATTSPRQAAIREIAYHLPEAELTNDALAEAFPEWSAEKILEKTGIRTRRIATEEQFSSDLGVAAAEKLFATGVCTPDQIDFVLFVTQTPDYVMPSTACLVHHRLALRPDCGAADIGLGCSGWVYGLAMAKGLIESLGLNNVLLITAETYSKIVHPRDRSVRTIFGDGAAATLISAVESEEPMLGPFVFGTDGAGVSHIVVPAGGFRRRTSEETRITAVDKGGNERSADNIYMNGPEVFNFTLKAVPQAVNALLERASLTREDVDYFVFHQANRFMLDRLRDKMRIDPARFCLEMEDCGNTVSSTVPIALARSQGDGRIAPGARVMYVAFGVGYSWAAGMMKIASQEMFDDRRPGQRQTS